jgi:hypothetical protein
MQVQISTASDAPSSATCGILTCALQARRAALPLLRDCLDVFSGQNLATKQSQIVKAIVCRRVATDAAVADMAPHRHSRKRLQGGDDPFRHIAGRL